MVSQDEARRLIRDVDQSFRGDIRKWNAYERWLVYEEAFPQLIAARISDTHEDPDTITRMKKWVDVTSNLALDILPQICVCWKNGAKRSVRGASDRQNGALRDLYEQLGIDSMAAEWNQQAYYFTELLVMPQVAEDGTVEITTALPHMYEPIPHPLNPMRDAGYIYVTDPKRLSNTEYVQTQLAPNRRDVDYVIVDDAGWRQYDGATGELVDSKDHNLGYVPAVKLNFHTSYGGHRWAHSKRAQRLHDATLAAALVNTTMSFVRKAQNRKLYEILGRWDAGQDGPIMDPETGTAISADNTAAVATSVHDFDTSPDHFIQQIQWIYQSAAQAHGGYAILEPGKQSGAPRVEFEYDAQSEIRDRQLPVARKFERSLAATLCDVMRAANHPDAVDLPDSDKIREGHSVDFGNLSRKFADPKAQKEWFEFLKTNGAADPRDIVRMIEGAHLNDEQCKAIIDEHMEYLAEFNEFAASRMMPMNGEGVTSVDEANGMQGPQVRDKDKPPAKADKADD